MMNKLELYKKNFSENDSPGLDEINKCTNRLYTNQEPSHFANTIPYELGGEEPLWAIDCFKSNNQAEHLHYISLGFTNLFYNEDLANDSESGYGFELTFRILNDNLESDIPAWPLNLIQNLAKYVFSTDKVFDNYHFISANGPIKIDSDTDITAIVFFEDQQLSEIQTPNGSVKFLQIYGITSNEYELLINKEISAEELVKSHLISNPLLITDLKRK